MAQSARDGSYYIMSAMTTKLMADFDHTKVTGLAANPIITRTVTHKTPEPYIYFYETDSSEEWVTKTSESRLHSIVAQVVIRDTVGRGTAQQRDEIVNQIIENLSDQTDYPDPSGRGYGIQRVTTGNIVKYETTERGGRFYIANVPLEVTAYYAGFSIAVQPVAAQTFTYTGWEHNPSSSREIELYDAGTITVGSTYADSNGWELVSSTVAKSAGNNDGNLSGRTLTVARGGNNIGLTTTFNWRGVDDNDTTTTTTDTDNFSRIRSLRFGSIASASKPVFTDTQDDDTGLQKLDNFNIDFGQVRATGEEITIEADAGEYMYIIYDAAMPALSSVTESVFNQDVLDVVFDSPQTIGGYRVYVSTLPIYYDDSSFTYTLG